VIAVFRHELWITPTHAVAYALMFVGGILPACGGQLSALTERAFWQQSFVGCAIAAEFALGLHDLMLSGCAYTAPGKGAPPSSPPSSAPMVESATESFEFFVWSRCSFVFTFVGMYAFSPRLNAQLRDLTSGRVAPRYISLSAVSEALTVVGFYLASIAYGLFYQAGVVHAAEASLSQLLNLLLAFILLKCFGVGRPSSVGSMRAKLFSFCLVTVGLFLCTLEAGPSPSAPMSLLPEPSAARRPMDNLWGDDDGRSIPPYAALPLPGLSMSVVFDSLHKK